MKVRGVGVGGWWPTTGTLAGYGAARLEGYLARVAVGVSHCANVCVYEVRVFFFQGPAETVPGLIRRGIATVRGST